MSEKRNTRERGIESLGVKRIDKDGGVTQETIPIANDAFGGILQATGTHPTAHRLGRLKLSGDAGKLGDKLEELLLRAQFLSFRIETRVELQAHATEWIGRLGVVVEVSPVDSKCTTLVESKCTTLRAA